MFGVAKLVTWVSTSRVLAQPVKAKTTTRIASVLLKLTKAVAIKPS
jgi:hypothetical protein